MLDAEQLQAAWTRYGEHTKSAQHRGFYTAWWGAYRELVGAVQTASTSDLARPDWQARLWTDRSITPVGPGDSINVSVLYGDPDVVPRIVELRTTSWSAVPGERAHQIQRAYDDLIELVATKAVRVRPAAKLKRIFAAMLPRDLTCVMAHEPNRNAGNLLVAGGPTAHLALQVQMRHRLRDVLGAESGLDDDIERSCFCWWLHENYAALSSESKASAVDYVAVAPERQQERPPLELWAFGKQYKGIPAVSGLDMAYRSIVRHAQARISRDDLVEVLRSEQEFDDQQPKSVRLHINVVKGLGFLDEKDGLLCPSRTGEELLEDEQPDVLVEALLQRVYGYAQLLRLLAGTPQGRPIESLTADMQQMYPNWTSNRPVQGLLRWSMAVGLVEPTDDRRYTLSSYGDAWAERLPRQLPAPPPTIPTGPELEPSDAGRPAATSSTVSMPDFGTIVEHMQHHPQTKGFVFDDVQVAALDAAWRLSDRKRFVILSGLSGTGKTAVVIGYAHVVCAALGLDPARHLAIVPVSPDWRDPSAMLGYFNALHADPTFHVEPTLRLLLDASGDPGRPYFLLLDEMNLARVELYFAPLLSAMETGRELVLHANDGPVNGVAPRIPWPRNLFIAGTVNMDESTHPFSDKVLDRAFTLEFWDVNLPGYFAKRREDGRPTDDLAQAVLRRLHELLAPVRRHFGYRTAGEVLDFVAALQGPPEQALDLAVFAKVLPRLRGEETAALGQALTGVAALCGEHGLTRSAAKVKSMIDRLQTTGVTKFWA